MPEFFTKVFCRYADTYIMRTELLNILNTMDVPEMRKELSNGNLRWLLRNLAVRNSDHPDITKAIELIRTLLFR